MVGFLQKGLERGLTNTVTELTKKWATKQVANTKPATPIQEQGTGVNLSGVFAGTMQGVQQTLKSINWNGVLTVGLIVLCGYVGLQLILGWTEGKRRELANGDDWSRRRFDGIDGIDRKDCFRRSGRRYCRVFGDDGW
jgi:hypothetical protein